MTVDRYALEAGLLSSPEAADLLRAALTGDPAVDIPDFTFTLDDLHYRPGAEVSAVYTVRFSDPQGNLVEDSLIATTADVAGEVAVVHHEIAPIRIWRHPADPRLPGLAPSCDPDTVLEWFAPLHPDHQPPHSLDLELLAYRPLRRAVVRARVDTQTFFCKVLRPGYDDALVLRQQALANAGLTEPVFARPAPGVVWTRRVPGQSLAQSIVDAHFENTPLPDPHSLIELLDCLPADVENLPPRGAWSDHLDFHRRTAEQRLPEHHDRIRVLTDAIETVRGENRHGPLVPTHGDFYEANVFVDGQRLWLVDVDSVGPGLREDDLACCLAHLAVLPSLAPDSYPHVGSLVTAWRDVFEQSVDQVDLRMRVAAVLLTLVSGAPAGDAHTRLRLAEQWADSATALNRSRSAPT